MEDELTKTPEQRVTSVTTADTVLVVKNVQPAQSVRTLQDIINELNTTYFFSYRRFRLKKEFLTRLRDSNVTGNATLLQDFVLEALLKYVSAYDRQEILGMMRHNNESALPFAISRRVNDLQKIKLLVEKFKIPVKQEWVSLRSDDPEVTIYLQKSTALYTAVQKKDVDGFKMALKANGVKLSEYAALNIVEIIQSKIRENQRRHPVVRYFLNRKWNRMLRSTTGQVKKQLFTQAKKNAISPELLALLNQCPLDEIYYALTWYDHDNLRLYDKFKELDLREYLNIYLQMEEIASMEAQFECKKRSRVFSNAKIVRQVGGPVIENRSENTVHQEPLPVKPVSDMRTRFHKCLRENDVFQVRLMLRRQLLSVEDVQEVLDTSMEVDDGIKQDLQGYVERFQDKHSSDVKRVLFGQ